MEINQQELEKVIEKLKDYIQYCDIFYDGKDFELIKNGLYLYKQIRFNPYSTEWKLITDDTVYTGKDIDRIISEKLGIKISSDFLIYFSSEYLSFSTLRYMVDGLAIDFYGWHYYGGQNRGVFVTKEGEKFEQIKFLSIIKYRNREIYEKYLCGKNITLCSPADGNFLNYIDKNLGHNKLFDSVFIYESESTEDLYSDSE